MERPKKISEGFHDGCEDYLCRGCEDLGYIEAYDKWVKFLPSEAELHEIFHEESGEQISLSIAKGLKGIYKRLGGK